jgi:hypothetical protein
MKSEIKTGKSVIHSNYNQLQTKRIDGKLVLFFTDKASENSVRFHLNKNDVQIMLAHLFLNASKPIPILHNLFRQYPSLRNVLTEALLTFDTEAGGETMNLEAEESGKEEQP